MTGLQVLWFVLVFVLIGGYFILDGFDLGAGVLYNFVAKDEEEKAIVRTAIGPIWDGNEVWLITGGGALFAAFAPVYATTFSGFYWAILFVLFGLIVRAIALEYRGHDRERGGMWDKVFFIGSFVPALLFGVALGNCIWGIPLNAHGDYTGTFLGLLNPFSLLVGLLGLTQMILQGATWIMVKTEATSSLYERCRKVVRVAIIFGIVFFIALTFMVMGSDRLVLSGGPSAFLRIVFVALYVVALAACFVFAGRKSEIGAFLSSSLTCIATLGLGAASMFPVLVNATDPTLALSIMNSVAGHNTLVAMTVIACIGVPLVLIYYVIVFRIFRGKVDISSMHY